MSAIRGARLGLYGGTFNPIHLGHLRAAEEVAEALGLERVLFVPSARPPHKEDADHDPIAPAAARLEWTRLAVAGNPRFGVDPIEVERHGPSFLVQTLRAVRERSAPEIPVFILGRDAFEDLGNWREPEALLELAHFAVTTRPGLGDEAASLSRWIPERLRDQVAIADDGRSGRHLRASTELRLVEISALDISATGIRRRLRSGQSARYLLPEPVREAVEANGCFGPAARRPRDADQRAMEPRAGARGGSH